MVDNSNYMAKMQHDDQSISTKELVEDYANQIQELRTSVKGLTPEQVLARPIAGKWSMIEVVSHIADTEVYFSDRIERTIALERPLLIGVDEQPYPSRLNYQAFDMEEQFNLFSALRTHVARILRGITGEDWQRTAVHSGTGLMNLRQLVFQPIRHVRHHLVFIAEKRKVLG